MPAPSGFLHQAQASATGPALVFDPVAGAIVEANVAGLAALGVDAASIQLPLMLDCAMPAVQRLREVGGRACPNPTANEILIFWTPRGCLSFACDVSIADEAGALVIVRLIETVPNLQARQPAVVDREDGPDSAPSEAADLVHDVALRAKLAHELRTPLGAVLAYAEILKDEHFGPLASERYQGYARDIHESARHAMGVIDSMLEGGAEPSHATHLTFADVDPADIVESCLAVARPLAERAGLVLTTEVPAQLPRVVADAVSVRQMLLNLLANAIKFARRGDRVKVTVAYDGDGPLRIAVVDTGPGMDELACQAKGPRHMAGPRAANAGMGLGLPLTRTLAEANGAVLAIDSAIGRGTCATISFGKERVVPV